jgi:hypothetical protein
MIDTAGAHRIAEPLQEQADCQAPFVQKMEG